MKDIKEEVEYAEISSILDSNGNIIEEFEEPKKSKIHKKEKHIKSGAVLPTVIVSIALMAVMIFFVIKLIPIMLGIMLLSTVINAVANMVIRIIKRQ